MALSPEASGVVRLHPARPEHAPLLEAWDLEPHVIACSTDDPDAEEAFDDVEWAAEIAAASPVSFHLIAEVDGRPIGAMQVIDPALEPTRYWGEIGPGHRAIDIWIGPKDALARGYGTQMMTQVLDEAFADASVHSVVIDPLNTNTAAHRFYHRLGFEAVGRRVFNDVDDCLVMRLTRVAWESRPRP